MDRQVSISMIYYIIIYYIMIKNLELNHLSPEWNLHWGEGTPNRWYERSEKVPNGLRPLIEVKQIFSTGQKRILMMMVVIMMMVMMVMIE